MLRKYYQRRVVRHREIERAEQRIRSAFRVSCCHKIKLKKFENISHRVEVVRLISFFLCNEKANANFASITN